MRFHSQTAGVTLTAQQPMNNVVRVAYQALAAVLGGTQSLHTNSMDETLALPTEQAVQVALRTQQILAYETGVPNVIDPLGGSYYVEALTDELERAGRGAVRRDRGGGRRGRGAGAGLVPASDRRVRVAAAVGDRAAPQGGRRRERVRHRRGGAHDSARFASAPRPSASSGSGSRSSAPSATRRCATARLTRCARRPAARDNLLPFILDAARAYCTLFEIRACARGRVRRVSRTGVLLTPRTPNGTGGTAEKRAEPAAAKARRAAGAGKAGGGTATPPITSWWKGYFDAQYLREYEPLFALERDRHEVARLIDILGAAGRRARSRLPVRPGPPRAPARRGGLRRGRAGLLRRAAGRGRARAAPAACCATGAATCGACRRAGRGRFDAVVNLFTSFGFFATAADDARVIAEFARVLKPGGVLVWHGGSRDGVMARFLARDWWRTADGTMIAHERRVRPALRVPHASASTWQGPAGRRRARAPHPALHRHPDRRALRGRRTGRDGGVRRLG